MDDPTSPPSAPQPPLLAAVSAARSGVVTAAGSFDPDYLRTRQKGQLVREIDCAVSALLALKVRTLAGGADLAEDAGARDPGTWAATFTKADFAKSRSEYRLGLRLARRPIIAASFGRGEVSVEHVRAVLASLDDLPGDLDAETVASAEKHLLALCEEHPPREVRTLGRKILEVVAPDVAEAHLGRLLEAAEARAIEDCRLDLYDRGDSGEFHGHVPKPTWLTLKKILEAKTSPRRNDPDFDDLDTGQKRGRAFVELIEQLPVDGFPTAGRSPVQTVVTLDLANLQNEHGHATLDDGTLVTAGQARREACQAGVIPAVLGGDSEVLDLGRRHRFASPHQVLALRLRQPTCAGDGCTVPAAWCDAHHRNPWSEGGATDLEDLVLLCGHHHHRAHDPTYRATWHPSGAVTFHRTHGRR